jgi:hypothetical protein
VEEFEGAVVGIDEGGEEVVVGAIIVKMGIKRGAMVNFANLQEPARRAMLNFVNLQACQGSEVQFCQSTRTCQGSDGEVYKNLPGEQC